MLLLPCPPIGLRVDYVYRVRRDENGAIDPEGSFQNTNPTKLSVKYNEEIRLALGVLLYEHPDSKLEGRIIKPFSYT